MHTTAYGGFGIGLGRNGRIEQMTSDKDTKMPEILFHPLQHTRVTISHNDCNANCPDIVKLSQIDAQGRPSLIAQKLMPRGATLSDLWN